LNRFLVAALVLPAALLICASGKSQVPVSSPPKREVRAVWLTTVLGLDWPKSTNTEEQQRSLVEIVDRLSRARFNTIYFQVRSRADALYRSEFEPWSQQLTGTLGLDPGYDPLALIIREAHARGMEVHAWINAFFVRSGKAPPPPSVPPHVALSHPEWLHLIEGDWWLDPGIPAARRFVLSVAMDIVRRYDVDGIHFDYLRYPDKLFPDEAVYRRYGGSLSKEDWRRENITKFVRAFYDSASALKPMLKVGCAPIGIYANVGNVRGLQGYSDVYQDARGWLSDRKLDYLVPQLYWPLGQRPGSPDFAEIAGDWAAHAYGRDVYPGIGAYKPEVFDQLPRLIDVSRSLGFRGNSFFRYGNIERALDLGGRYQTLANIPPMKWKDSIPPNPPRGFRVSSKGGGVFRLEWDAPAPAGDGDIASCYDVYRSRSSPVDVSDPANLVAIVRRGDTQRDDTILRPAGARYFYACSSLDKGNNESRAVEQAAFIPEIAEALRPFSPGLNLGRNYPDPASSLVFIPYEIREAVFVSLTILDAENRELLQIVKGLQPAGSYVAAADISRLRTGLYGYRLTAGTYSRRESFRVSR